MPELRPEAQILTLASCLQESMQEVSGPFLPLAFVNLAVNEIVSINTPPPSICSLCGHCSELKQLVFTGNNMKQISVLGERWNFSK